MENFFNLIKSFFSSFFNLDSTIQPKKDNSTNMNEQNSLTREQQIPTLDPVVQPIVNQSENNSQVIVNKPAPVLATMPLEQTKLDKWVNLIAHFEGANPILNNPGNFKYSTLLGTWGGQRSSENGSDGGVFCKFPTLEMGYKALHNFLILGCENQLADYHNARTIKEFTEVYTNHPKPQFDYSDNLIKELGVTADTQISTFL
jgi:hypothetical protein